MKLANRETCQINPTGKKFTQSVFLEYKTS